MDRHLTDGEAVCPSDTEPEPLRRRRERGERERDEDEEEDKNEGEADRRNRFLRISADFRLIDPRRRLGLRWSGVRLRERRLCGGFRSGFSLRDERGEGERDDVIEEHGEEADRFLRISVDFFSSRLNEP